MSNLVITGQMGNMAAVLAKALGRRIDIHRVEYRFKTGGGKFKTQIRYTLVIEGSHPPMFPGLTVNEVKGRMAMITDLLYSGVIKRADEHPVPLSRAESRAFASDGQHPTGHGLEAPSDEGHHPGVGQSASLDDSY